MKPAPKTASELKKEAESLELTKKKKRLTKPREQLITVIESSRKIDRQIGHATILLIGPSGAGKSSTINHVFNLNHNFANTSESESATRNIKEYNIINDSQEYDAKDVSLGVIDSPGLGETAGLQQEACNLVAIKTFFKERKKVFPNLIFVVANALDERFDGPNLPLMRTLICLHRLKLVDKKNQNVVGVMTHTGALAKRQQIWIEKFEVRRKRMKKLIKEQLEVQAPVVALENKPYDQDLEFDGDYSILPDDKTKQPRNLYKACANLLTKNKDEFGLLAVNLAFTGSKQKVESGCVLEPTDANKEELGSKEKKYLEFCRQLMNGEEVGGNTSDEGDGDDGDDGDDGVPVEESDNKKVFHDGKRFLAEGYNIFSDKTSLDPIFNTNPSQNDYGVLLPNGAKFLKSGTTESFQETYTNRRQKICQNMMNYTIGSKVMSPDFSHLGAKAGVRNVQINTTATNSEEFSFIEEQRLFQAEIQTETLKSLPFTNEFKKAVEYLPYKFKYVDDFDEFFDKWGTYVISQAFIGGSIEVTVKMKSDGTEESNSSSADFRGEVSALLSCVCASAGPGFSNQTTESHSTLLKECTVSFKGGDESLHSKITLADPKEMKKWRESIKTNPVMLKKDLTLTPISKLVGYINQEKETACSEALKKYVESQLISKREDDVVPIEKKEYGCFPGSAMVRKIKDGVLIDIEMKKLAVGDSIETKKGFSKVLLFAHYVPDKILNYLKILTVDGQCLRLTGNHLIFVSSDKHTKLAYAVKPGDELIRQDKEKTSKVVSVEEITEAGLFCPITEDGTIYVDGILTSCYASCKPFFNVDAHHLAHLGLLPMRILKVKPGQVKEMHPYIEFLDKLPLPFRMSI